MEYFVSIEKSGLQIMPRTLTLAGRCTQAGLFRFRVGDKEFCKEDFKAINIFFVHGSIKYLASSEFDYLIDKKIKTIDSTAFKLDENKIAFKTT